jgi:DNA-binding response OmpR family regulator
MPDRFAEEPMLTTSKKQPKILLIDDDPNVLEILSEKLRSVGYKIVTASAGLDGLNTVYKESPNLIILDLMLPQLDGLQVCRILKFDERYKKTPIIMLTGRTEEKNLRLGLKAGANKYLTKPFEPNQVLNEVKQLLSPS